MRDYVNIGPGPADEPCPQVGDPQYLIQANTVGLDFIELIRNKLGREPEGAQLKLKRFSHDFGSYYEVVCWYDESLEASVEYAFKVEAEAPTRWEKK